MNVFLLSLGLTPSHAAFLLWSGLYPKNLLRLFFRNNLARLKISLEVKNKRLFSPCFKRYFRAL